MISQLFSYMAAQIGETAMDHPGWTFSLLPILLPLLAWRLWTFTLRPLWKPDEVEYLPYWIPCKFRVHLPPIYHDVDQDTSKYYLQFLVCSHFKTDGQNASLNEDFLSRVGHAISFFKDSGALFTRGKFVPSFH